MSAPASDACDGMPSACRQQACTLQVVMQGLHTGCIWAHAHIWVTKRGMLPGHPGWKAVSLSAVHPLASAGDSPLHVYNHALSLSVSSVQEVPAYLVVLP